MFKGSYRIMTLFGIPIRLHFSLVLIVFLLVSEFGWVQGLLLEAGLIASIVLHELGHSLVAIRKGCRVREITLLCIGGAAQMSRIPTRPMDEFLMAIAGPAVSLVLGLVLLPAGMALFKVHEIFRLVEALGLANLWLVGFNLIPAFPMDGGRVLRAALSPKFGRLRATEIAARLGQIVALLMVVGGLIRSYWILAFVGAFVFWAARQEYALVRLQEFQKRVFGWSWMGDNDEPEDDDSVLIGPPPYDPGAASRASIQYERGSRPYRDAAE